MSVEITNNTILKILFRRGGSAERENIVKRAEDEKKRAEQAMSVAKMWTSIQNSLMLVAVEVLQPLVDYLNSGAGKEWMMGLAEGLISFAKGIRDSWPEIKKTMKAK